MQLIFTKTGQYIPIPDLGPVRSRLALSGLGAQLPQDQQQIAGIAATAATTTAGILVALGAIGGPVGAAVAGLASIGIAVANMFAGCGQTCVQASNYANQFGDVMAQNLNHYMGSPTHYASMQAAALNNYDIGWAALEKACGAQALAQAGVNCIADRQRGACKWKSSPGGWAQDSTGKWVYTSPGPAGSGNACWNYFIGMRDPIANDPTVVPDPVGAVVDPNTGAVLSVTPQATSTTTLSSSSAMPLLLIGGGILAAVLLMGGD